MNTRLSTPEVEYIRGDSGACILLVDARLAEVEQALSEHPSVLERHERAAPHVRSRRLRRRPSGGEGRHAADRRLDP
jgi:hypothetical protein